jgi:methylthioribose-1-phosphate isomerase
VAAPLSTIDASLSSGAEIPIEERASEEVLRLGTQSIAPDGVQAAHPAFDVTPARYVTAIITERGIAHAPYTVSLARLAESGAEFAPDDEHQTGQATAYERTTRVSR